MWGDRVTGNDKEQTRPAVATGAKCLSCGTVVVQAGEFLAHVLEEGHRWWKSGETVFRISLRLFEASEEHSID